MIVACERSTDLVQLRVEAKLFAGFTDQEREQLMSYLSRVQHNAL